MQHHTRTPWKRGMLLALTIMMAFAMSACGSGASSSQPSTGNQTGSTQGNQDGDSNKAKGMRDIKVVLDWSPNTNHTGLYVAKDQGFYEAEGLNVEIIPPGQAGADALVASGEAQFGVSYQESITQARTQDVPIVSIAAVIQHNTSGFAAPTAKKIKTPKDFEGKTYGGWGSPVEEAVLRSIMEQEGADYSKVKNVSMGDVDFFTATKKDIDFAWIFYAWTGIEAELRNEPVDMMYVNQYSDKLDYYTPVLATNERLIKADPELIKAFMRATSKGYQLAIDKPEDAANMLLKAVPDLNKELVMKSQQWLAPKYKDDAPRWGEQKRSVWDNYMNWLLQHKLLEQAIDVDKAFTNDFLP
ncbi:ABC transporter substrate-binding protein [Paenibacillus sp. 481]|uniref:ABC transporter substrate-binding protein n=1 Tax=Paenibacillus sp. 481 TaxID=2835869 RepID=UPI001E577CC6|nr:ABC transporter substrate-binding protein [Paenibacillus sp. 481]UHA75573.1 ABC transporter substrate-binding protein [Paenibacillus sp. 481]